MTRWMVSLSMVLTMTSCHDRPFVVGGSEGEGTTLDSAAEQTGSADDQAGSGDGRTDGAGVCEDGCFGMPDEVPVPIPLDYPLLVADFDGDGRLDLASHSGALFREEGLVFAPPVGLGRLDEGEVVVFAGDVDGDGCADVLGRSSDGGLLIHFGRADRGFDRVVVDDYIDNRKIEPIGGVFADDFDGDGRDDVAVLTHGEGQLRVHVLLSRADRTFSPTLSLNMEAHPAAVLTGGHIDEDGHVDLVLFRENAQVHFNRGDGTFDAPVSTEALFVRGRATLPHRSAAAVDARGVAFGGCSGNYSDACYVGVLSAAPTRELVLTGFPGTPATALAVGDFRGDGRGGFVSASIGPPSLELFCASAGAALERCDVRSIPHVVATAAALDVDEDGLEDLVFIGESRTTLHVLYAIP